MPQPRRRENLRRKWKRMPKIQPKGKKCGGSLGMMGGNEEGGGGSAEKWKRSSLQFVWAHGGDSPPVSSHSMSRCCMFFTLKIIIAPLINIVESWYFMIETVTFHLCLTRIISCMTVKVTLFWMSQKSLKKAHCTVNTNTCKISARLSSLHQNLPGRLKKQWKWIKCLLFWSKIFLEN